MEPSPPIRPKNENKKTWENHCKEISVCINTSPIFITRNRKFKTIVFHFNFYSFKIQIETIASRLQLDTGNTNPIGINIFFVFFFSNFDFLTQKKKILFYWQNMENEKSHFTCIDAARTNCRNKSGKIHLICLVHWCFVQITILWIVKLLRF